MTAVLLGVLAAFSWSLHDLFARSLGARVGPFRMAIAVMLGGALLLTAFVLGRNVLWHAPWSAISEGLLLGLAYGLGGAGLFKAFSLGPISLVGPVSAIYPVLVVLWGMAHGLSPTAVQWAAIAATVAGAVVVVRMGHADGGINAVPRRQRGTLAFFCVLSSLGYAVAVVVGQAAAVSLGEIEATWLSRFTAVLSILPFMLGEARPAPLAWRHWGGIGAMAAFDVIGIVAVIAAGHWPDKELAAVGVSAYGAIAVILAMLVLKEKVAAGQWLGIVLIVAGVATLSLSQ